MARWTSLRAPAGQARRPQSRPITLPVTTSIIRASESRQVTGSICANAAATTRVNRPCAYAMPSSGPRAKATSITGASRAAYTSVWGPRPIRSAPATSAPAAFPATAWRTACQVAPAVVRPRVRTTSSTQKPWERSREPATARAAARPSAVRTAFWNSTERNVALPTTRRAQSLGVERSAYQKSRRGRAGSVGLPWTAMSVVISTIRADSASASTRE